MMAHLPTLIGLLFIIAGMILNPWFFNYAEVKQTPWVPFWTYAVLLADSILILFGLTILKFRWQALINALFVILAIALSTFFMESVLRTGVFDQKDKPRPIWIPPSLKKADRQIDVQNEAFARTNRYFFTDIEHSYVKTNPRIAFLGDSFIWGDGLPFQETWNHKLGQMIVTKWPKIEALHWGRNGWSTKDAYDFLSTEGIKYKPDLVVFGFCVNDPDMGDIPQRYLNLKYLRILKPLKQIFPNVTELLSSAIEYYYGLADKDFGYRNWEQKLYEAKNLHRYEILLREISGYCKSHDLNVLFVLTPNNHLDYFRDRFGLIATLLDRAGIPHLNTHPVVLAKLGHIQPRELWANPADGHPGSLVTQVVAEETLKHITPSLMQLAQGER